ncbi:MAG: agmatine deiminase family protein [Bacteroides sp.]|nr:agmatine deiminase family protein [Bacteroides sp.]
MTNDRRLPAEWEYDGPIMLAWPHAETDWAYMLDEVAECYTELVKALTEEKQVIIVAPDISVPKAALSLLPQDKIFYFECQTNDTWTRDYGPICVEDDRRFAAIDYKFNGWGLKFASAYDNMVTLRMFGKGLLSGKRINRLSFVLEGGSIDSDGTGCVITTSECLMSANRNGSLTRAEIESELKKQLGAERLVWIDHGALAGDDTDSHVDTLVRFSRSGALLYAGCENPKDSNYEELQAMKRQLHELSASGQLPDHLLELPSPDPIFDEDGQQLPATYANFLATRERVYMPTYGQPQNDELAAKILEVAFGTPVRKVDCRALIRQHGSLHCATMQLPASLVSFI